MQDFSLWTAASDLLNHLTTFEPYTETELRSEYEALVKVLAEFREQCKAVSKERFLTVHLVAEISVQAFGQTFEGDPLSVLDTIGYHVQTHLDCSMMMNLDASIQLYEFCYGYDELGKGTLENRAAIISGYCSDWFGLSFDFSSSRDSKVLFRGLERQCGAIYAYLSEQRPKKDQEDKAGPLRKAVEKIFKEYHGPSPRRPGWIGIEGGKIVQQAILDEVKTTVPDATLEDVIQKIKDIVKAIRKKAKSRGNT